MTNMYKRISVDLYSKNSNILVSAIVASLASLARLGTTPHQARTLVSSSDAESTDGQKWDSTLGTSGITWVCESGRAGTVVQRLVGSFPSDQDVGLRTVCDEVDWLQEWGLGPGCGL